MYLRTVLRSMPSCRAMADIVRACRCRSRIIMSSPRVTTALLPPAKGSSIGGDGASPPHRKCPGRQAATTKLGKIRRPQLGRIQRPLTHGTSQYYYHSFLAEQPDLNWRNPQMRMAMAEVLRF